jgi:hypothetical protein
MAEVADAMRSDGEPGLFALRTETADRTHNWPPSSRWPALAS